MAMEKEKMGKMCGSSCMMGYCSKCMHGTMLVVGILILLNAMYLWMSWGVFVGGIIALKGLLGMMMPYCPHCKDKE